MIVLVPDSLARVLEREGPWGKVSVTGDSVEDVVLVRGHSVKAGALIPAPSSFPSDHYTHRASQLGLGAVWYRVPAEVNLAARAARMRRAELDSRVIADHVQGWKGVGPETGRLVLTVAPRIDGQSADLAAWLVTQGRATPLDVEVVPDTTDYRDALRPHWPIHILDEALFVVIGLGSIGSVTAEALLNYGARRLVLVDHDRLRSHNLVRFPATRRDLGRFKVKLLREQLLHRFPYADITAQAANVIDQADSIRPLLLKSAVTVCCADGVEARQATAHLAWRARTPLVFGCVLDAGGLGEVIRLRPTPRTGCLRCQRAAIVAKSGMDIEAGIDADYEQGTHHAPMTAVGGDLGLMGYWTAKAAIATVLESAGFAEQQLPGDIGLVGLRPAPDLAPPFNLRGPAHVVWHPAAPPRPECTTCGAFS